MEESIDCEEAITQLQDYLKRELTPGLAAEVKAHIERCRSCFDQAQFEQNFFRLLETRGTRETCPEKLRRRIMDLLRSEAGRG
jgi:anti-sigma factor (TIGR02949 family)